MTALWNAPILWPQCSRFLFNPYHGHATLVVHGSPEFIYSREGVTLGDSLSMLFYAVAMLPLVRSHSETNSWTQISGPAPAENGWYGKLKLIIHEGRGRCYNF